MSSDILKSMDEIITNEQRRYLGLEQIGDQWDVVEYCNRQNSNDHIYLLFDGDMVHVVIEAEE